MNPRDVSTLEFNYLIRKVREYCYSKRLIEACVQHRKSYATVCEDPRNVMISKRKVNGGGEETFPLPQTGQMQLEREMQHFIEEGLGHLFQKTSQGQQLMGFFALNFSYRDEDHEESLESPENCKEDPSGPPRYRRQFPMFEVELATDFEGLIEFITGFLKHLGFPVHLAKRGRWIETARRLKVKDIDREAERRLGEETPIFFLTHFPLEAVDEFDTTEPFWNMKRDPKDPRLTLKVDVIMKQEVFGCAERSCDPDDMRKRFLAQHKGTYHQLLFKIAGDGNLKKGKKKVMAELEDYWKRPFITRSGFGMGWTRLTRVMRDLNLFPTDLVKANVGLRSTKYVVRSTS